ncbi:hypothetical protein ACFYE9_21045 [Rhizobium leguminosarum]|uniref:Uncharacterized protein n=2 Tax=Rhizobium leguminosarum TaxID=384 RepID=A0A154IJZ1_RHILE|nr:hypothetical protein [Rhizobium leguminosarum]KZB00438.1 hypothetical protein A4A59_18780 [Rhizobium leguminosarum]
MIFRRTIHRLFLAIVMLAIIIGPMSIGLASSAMASSAPAMTDGMSGAMAGMQMAEQMPCCPEQQPVKPDCAKGCPLSLVCTTSIFAHAPDVHGWSFAISWASHRYHLIPASQLTPASVEPPARPPKA